QIRESIDRIDEYRGILHIRRHLAASPLFKSIPDFRRTRIAMLRADTFDSLLSIIDHVENDILS
ncbi:MAG: tRNA dihydrouridine synthase DusB, partial [Muribaculaceae bacterium]|nr:tRNA dihydrouridine synthase DusB [Muribaculaceae bacterium]